MVLPRKIVVLDDDPTGTQTVNGVEVLSEWSRPVLEAVLKNPSRCVFVMTNSRSMPEARAVKLYRTIARTLRSAAQATGREYSVISRSDSTLRGHFPAETDALASIDPGRIAGTIVIPAFFEAGRSTRQNIHLVKLGRRNLPVAETEFARDTTFGYKHSDLTQWIEEKTAGRVKSSDVVSVSLGDLRAKDAVARVKEKLLEVPVAGYVIVNATRYRDLETFVAGLNKVERTGRNFLFRTAASFVRVVARIPAKPFLTRGELIKEGRRGGLVVVGSYTEMSTNQLHLACRARRTLGIELELDRLAAKRSRGPEIRRVAAAATLAIEAGTTAIIYTSRKKDTKVGPAGDLMAGRIVSDSLVSVVNHIPVRPRYVIGKGGITASDLSVRALRMRKSRVLGQVLAGVSVWRGGLESRFPGLSYLVFPGNVGEPDSLRKIVDLLNVRSR
jgi:uncharacterized protein YgbK (DUF1537 family)